jgi:putative toxin-antitoxin system antitoxin component (TIGR02293 family)
MVPAFHSGPSSEQVAPVLRQTEAVFGNQDKATGWLNTPHRLLDGQTPLEAIETDRGLQMVTTILGRIAYGVFS